MNRAFVAFGITVFLTATMFGVQASQKVIKDPAEYNAYMSALNAQDPAAKAAAMEAFATQYPASVVKVDALEQAMAAYQQGSNAAGVVQTAERILQIDGNHVRALAIIAAIKRNEATQSGDMKKAQDAGVAAEKGLAALPGWQKPEELTDEQFQKLHDQMASIFAGAQGFAALQAKNFPQARDFYLQSLRIDPNNMQDAYQLGVAELQMTPLDPTGFWYAGKAITLAQAQNNEKAATGITAYAKAMYQKFHGAPDGWDQLVAATAKQTSPPADFAVSAKKVPTPADLACQAVKDNDPKDLSFGDREFILSLRDAAPCNKQAADTVWASILSQEKHGEAKLQIPVKVITASSTIIEVALTDENQAANKADLRVTMAKPLQNPPAAGAMVDVVGVITDYKPAPFMFVMEKGELRIHQN
jgi:tetratricopeptide (TPR) repeat protein